MAGEPSPLITTAELRSHLNVGPAVDLAPYVAHADRRIIEAAGPHDGERTVTIQQRRQESAALLPTRAESVRAVSEYWVLGRARPGRHGDGVVAGPRLRPAQA